VPSKVVNNTVIMSTEIRTNDNSSTLAQCASRRGGFFNPNDTSSGYTISSPNNLAPDPIWDSSNPSGCTDAGNTTLQFALHISFSLSPIALALNAPNSSVGQLGLANDSVFLHHVVKDGLSPVAGFSLLAGS